MSKRSHSLRLTNPLMLGTLRQDCSGVNGSYFMSSRYLRLHAHAYWSHQC